MKKCLLIIVGAVLALTGCASTNGIKKEKIDDGLIRYSDAVTETIRYEHPALVSNPDSNKFNLHKGADSENINAYIMNDQLFLEASYECKSQNLLRLNAIVFMTDDTKLSFKKTRVLPSDLDLTDYHYEELINPYFCYSSVNNYSFEDFKIMLTLDEVEQLNSMLEEDTIYVSFVGERGRTDLFKLNKKVKFALRSVIDYLLYGESEPEIEEDFEDTLEEDFIESDDYTENSDYNLETASDITEDIEAESYTDVLTSEENTETEKETNLTEEDSVISLDESSENETL